jgi:hypothetical protein
VAAILAGLAFLASGIGLVGISRRQRRAEHSDREG